jgi:hypothetical protein
MPIIDRFYFSFFSMAECALTTGSVLLKSGTVFLDKPRIASVLFSVKLRLSFSAGGLNLKSVTSELDLITVPERLSFMVVF